MVRWLWNTVDLLIRPAMMHFDLRLKKYVMVFSLDYEKMSWCRGTVL